MDLVDEIAARGVADVLERDESAVSALADWLGGERMSERADEPELRVQAAWEARDLFDELGVFDRLTAMAILALPPGHEERDTALALGLLEDHLHESRDEGDAEEELRTIAALLSTSLPAGDAEPLLDRGAELAAHGDDPSGAAEFELSARSYCVRRYIVLDKAGDDAEAERWLERALGFGTTADDAGDEDLAAVVSLAEELDIAQRWPEAASVYRRLIDATSLEDGSVQQLALREGELRLMTDDVDGAAAALTEALPYIEARYLDAVRDEDVAVASERLAAAVDCLAVAQGAQADWSGVCRTLDRTRGLRLRQAAALRARPEGPQLLDAERRLTAALRGAPDTPPPAELLETYRRLLPPRTDALASPDGVELGRVLAPGEAVAFVAHHFTGTVVAVALPGPTVDGFVRDDFATADWILAFADDEEGPGWIDMLADPAAATPGAGLGRLIDAAEEAVGDELRELLDAHGAHRLTLLTEDVLRLIPWWALPSLEDLEVLAAGSAADLVHSRTEAAPAAPRTALVVANPTRDLPVTAAACEQAVAALERAGLDVASLPGGDATEVAVIAELGGRALLHFGGHGRSDVAYSALELSPDPPLPADPFPAWVAAVPSWRTPEPEEDEVDEEPEFWDHRWADLPEGRLHERQWLASGRLDRWLEHDAGTLAATYRDGACIRLAELWSAADLVVGDAVRDCRLAVLTACESASSGRGADSRALGLPAGLAFAGVRTVVGSLWPVDECLAALWAESFYAALARELDSGATTVDVAAHVHATATAMRELPRADAADRLGELARHTPDPVARFLLEADAARLDDPPFAATHHWAAFYVTGQATLEFEEATP